MWDAFQKFTNDVSRAYGKVDKKLGGILPGGAERNDTLKLIGSVPEAALMAAQETVPAIVGGITGNNRTDTNINPKMIEGIKAAHAKAKSQGRNEIQYEDYDFTTPGGMGAALTMGRLGSEQLKVDDQGNLTGLTEKFDTNKSPGEALSEINPLDPTTAFKPAEALLSAVQNRGLTTHDIDFADSSSKPSSQTNQYDSFMDDVSDRGLIPVHTFNESHHAIAGYLKSMAGPLGRPFRLKENDTTREFLQRTVDAADLSSDGTSLVFNKDIKDQDAYEAIGDVTKGFGNKIVGQYNATVDKDGNVFTNDVFDSNPSVEDNYNVFTTGRTPGGKKVNFLDRVASGLGALHTKAEESGWANLQPYGSKIHVGTIDRNKLSFQTSPKSTKSVTSPAMQAYEVAVGDTLTAIAAKHGLTIDEIARKNNITNVNNIGVGQKLKL